jgi:hypothetical protein
MEKRGMRVPESKTAGNYGVRVQENRKCGFCVQENKKWA